MNSRERLLGIGIGALVGLLLLYYLFDSLEQGITSSRAQVTRLEQQKSDLERRLRSAKLARNRWAEYRERSLPADREEARALYQKWLLTQVESSGLSNVTINAVTSPGRGDAYYQHMYSVTCKGNVEQLTTWMHKFYSVDTLHRLRQLTITPRSETKLLDLTFSVEALALADADNTELPNREGKRLQREGLAPYVKAIVGRNLFAPANQPPKIASLGTQRGNPRRSVSFAAKAEDPDKLDKVTFRLVDSKLSGAKFNASTGAFDWTPTENGEYEVVIEAQDDGLPAKTATQKVRIVISDPPPEPVAEKPTKKKLDFDVAKHTKLTGIVASGEEHEVWLTIRTTGEIQKLKVGDAINIGSIEGKVTHIGDDDFELETPERRMLISLGQNLLEGRELPLKPASASADGAT